MDLTIRDFILLLFALAFSAIFFLEPYHVARIEKRGIPQIAFVDFESYEITGDGVTGHLTGEKAEKFMDRLQVSNAQLIRLAPRGEESVRAKKALFFLNRRVELRGDVHLEKEGGWVLDTQRLTYIIDKKLYTTQGFSFVITYGSSVIHGKNLHYYQKSGKIKAESIDAKIAEEDI
ncbi:LPS export ABC transporter periplasmic protein LptC [Hydrogenimonas urashimensis]|uniref:LPS export ABC transporter periplasmic protein LptC n=1 Tax=Hydrogenimonas urashimensis TaxID=2740515 RepID=UPI0019166F5A|nr:LPS export ABC transporter periplasmic protein LptC [Hydrogenimonas urashimensis]